VREYRTHPAAVLKRSNATINNALAAVDDFYTRTGLGPAAVQRLDLAPLAPRALIGRAVTRWLRAAGTVESARDRALILTPFYAGARNGETVTLDLDDVRLSTRKGNVRFYGKGAKPRQVELHPQLREAYTAWLDERTGWRRRRRHDGVLPQPPRRTAVRPAGSVGGRADGDQAASERAAVAVAIGCAGASGRSGRNQAGGPGGGGQRCGGEGPLPLRRGRARGLSYTGAAPGSS